METQTPFNPIATKLHRIVESNPSSNCATLTDAAEEIDRLEAEKADLLAALEALVLHFPGSHDPSDRLACDQARAAIAKAKGNQ